MQDNLQFRVSAELKNILGRDLITSPDVAILELVKNSYDAHATKVEITFDEDYLRIADNGKGMSKDDLINKWLFVAYSAKSDGTEDSSYRSKFKRHYAGAKGIGRMSCDRLARCLTLTTRSLETNNTEVLYVDWKIFEQNKKQEFDTINIPHKTLDDIPQFPNNDQTGTILEFRGLHNLWGRKEILAIRKSLEKMINPFSSTDDDFQIEIIAPKYAEDDKDAKFSYDKVNGVIENSIADILKLKTTKIESTIKDGFIRTTLWDRDAKMYEIKEPNKFQELTSAQISIFFLNRAAKYSFSSKMGIQPVNYGNIFLFRNGFRILPFGNYNDDSWGINQRAQQGYNRFLGTRDLFGRVDVETDDINAIKEVSSRDGGLIQTNASKQLMEYFTLIHHRLERYVVGVLWGEGFLKKEYFKNQQTALQERSNLQQTDKDKDSSLHLYENIGSKIDFMQLIKSLANDTDINILYYNAQLADIVSNVSETELIQMQMIEDARKVAYQTGDAYLMDKITQFENHMDELRRQKEEADKKAEEERIKAQTAQKKAQEEQQKREKEEEKRIEAEKAKQIAEEELEKETKQVIFHKSIIGREKEQILGLQHQVNHSASRIKNNIKYLISYIKQSHINIDPKIQKYISIISLESAKIESLSTFITNANFDLKASEITQNIVQFIKEYIEEIYLPDIPILKTTSRIEIQCSVHEYTMRFRPLEMTTLIDNFVQNAEKAGAKRIVFEIGKIEDKLQLQIFNDGKPIPQEDVAHIFDLGFTTTDGSGIGLFTVKSLVERLKGNVSLDSNNENGVKFNIII